MRLHGSLFSMLYILLDILCDFIRSSLAKYVYVHDVLDIFIISIQCVRRVSPHKAFVTRELHIIYKVA